MKKIRCPPLRAGVTAALFLAALTPVSAQASQPPTDRQVTGAFGLLAAGETKRAAALFRKAEKRDPNAVMPLLGLAKTSNLRGRYAEAIGFAGRALENATAERERLFAFGERSFAIAAGEIDRRSELEEGIREMRAALSTTASEPALDPLRIRLCEIRRRLGPQADLPPAPARSASGAEVKPLRFENGEPIEPGGRVSAPRKIVATKPQPPTDRVRAKRFIMERAQRQGHLEARAEAVIDLDGCIMTATDAVESPNPVWSEAVREEVVNWVFEPARRDGEPVPVAYVLTVTYRVDL